MEIVNIEAGKGTQEIGIQCDLLLGKKVQRIRHFDIADSALRRRLVRRFYAVLILQLLCVMPCVELLLYYPLPYIKLAMNAVLALIFLMYSLLYLLRNYWRPSPYHYLVLLLVTLSSVIFRSLYLVALGRTHWLHTYLLILIAEIMVLMMYTRQHRFRFTNLYGFVAISITFSLLLVIAYFFDLLFEVLSAGGCLLEGWYIMYDTYRILTWHRGYNIKPDEYVFAACSIYIDIPILVWQLVFCKIINIIKWCRDCCRAEVC